MPSVRQRGSYAKFVCLNCRRRKIKCVLPDGVQLSDEDQVQSCRVTCKRCEIKGLDCVVDRTILGRPSQHQKSTRSRMMSSETGDSHPAVNERSQVSGQDSDGDSEHEADEVDDFLLVKPKTTSEGLEKPSLPSKLTTAERFLATVSVPYLLSMLLLRDKRFAVALTPRNGSSSYRLLNLLDLDLVRQLDRQLVWHRLYFPDTPRLVDLHSEISAKADSESQLVHTTLLTAVLCSLALDTPIQLNLDQKDLQIALDVLIYQLGQQLIMTLPSERYAILALELIMEYKPLALASDRFTAAHGVRNKLITPLVREIATSLGLQTAPQRLRDHIVGTGDFEERTLYDCLQWYRVCFLDILSTPPGDGQEYALKRLNGQTGAEVVSLFQDLLASGRLPCAFILAFHSLLALARQLESLLTIKSDWKDLAKLESVINHHKAACEDQRSQLRSTVHHGLELDPKHMLVFTQLLDAHLHASHCWISGVALFFCVMIGAAKTNWAKANQDDSNIVDQAMQVSDQIIERFAEPTREQYAEDPCTAFLVKYGEKRTDDLELVLANFLAAMDSLCLNNVSYVPPMRQTLCNILFTCKDIMEGNAARMKGWGGLHDRAHMQMLLIRNCAVTFERTGLRGSETLGEAARRGCLWVSTASSLKSLYGLMDKWQRWHALGKAVVHRETPGTSGASEKLEDVDMLDGLFPEDLFFDWNLWSQEDIDWSLV